MQDRCQQWRAFNLCVWCGKQHMQNGAIIETQGLGCRYILHEFLRCKYTCVYVYMCMHMHLVILFKFVCRYSLCVLLCCEYIFCMPTNLDRPPYLGCTSFLPYSLPKNNLFLDACQVYTNMNACSHIIHLKWSIYMWSVHSRFVRIM